MTEPAIELDNHKCDTCRTLINDYDAHLANDGYVYCPNCCPDCNHDENK